MLNIYELAQSSVFPTDKFHLKHLRASVVFNYFEQLVDQGVLTDEDQYDFFKTKIEDGYAIVSSIDFAKLIDKLQTIKDTNNKMDAFEDLAKFKKFWEETQ